MEYEFARKVVAARYKVAPEVLSVGPVWEIPEIGKRLLMFEINDPNHQQYKSTVCYDLTPEDTAPDNTSHSTVGSRYRERISTQKVKFVL
jgi:hypothetical protein